MRAFDVAWSVLKSFDATRRLPRRAKQLSSAAVDAEDVGRVAADLISREAEFHAQQEALREMGIHGAGHGFKNQSGAEFYSPLMRDPTTGFGSYRSREERGLPPPTLEQLLEQASYYNALDPQNDYTMLDHYAKYPTGGVTPLRVQDVMGE